jgi:putative DNA primase/helicase
LVETLGFFTQDEDQIDRLIRASSLHRDKWGHRGDYRNATIRHGIDIHREYWTGTPPSRNGQPTAQDSQASEAEHNNTEVGDDQPETEPEGIPIHLTDRGNALRLIKLYGNDLHYIYRWKKWLVWDGTRWVIDEGNLVEAMAKQVIVNLYAIAQRAIGKLSRDLQEGNLDESQQKKRAKEIDIATARLKWALKSESADKLAAMLKHAHSERGVAITPEQLDANPWILNCRNGTIDLKTGTLYKHRREDLCTKRVDVDYHPRARCKNAITFLYRIMGKPKPDATGLTQELRARRQRARRLVKFLQRALGYSLTGVTGRVPLACG